MIEKNGHSDSPNQGGSGGESELGEAMERDAELVYDRRGANGRSLIQNSRMMNRAIKNGWLGQRFPTGATVSDLQKVARHRELDLAEKAVVAVHQDISAVESPRVRQVAVRNAVAMERLNQKDELGETLNSIVNQTNVNIISSPEQREQCIEAIMSRLFPESENGSDD